MNTSLEVVHLYLSIHTIGEFIIFGDLNVQQQKDEEGVQADKT
jgi:hypothetical protein